MLFTIFIATKTFQADGLTAIEMFMIVNIIFVFCALIGKLDHLCSIPVYNITYFEWSQNLCLLCTHKQVVQKYHLCLMLLSHCCMISPSLNVHFFQNMQLSSSHKRSRLVRDRRYARLLCARRTRFDQPIMQIIVQCWFCQID